MSSTIHSKINNYKILLDNIRLTLEKKEGGIKLIFMYLWRNNDHKMQEKDFIKKYMKKYFCYYATELTGLDPGTSFPLSLWTQRSTLASSASSTKQYPAEPLHRRTQDRSNLTLWIQ